MQAGRIDGMMAGAIENHMRLTVSANPSALRMAFMRIHVLAKGVLTLAVLSLPAAGVAQKFQQPTKEELQMTADPKAPGAAAVFLYREESTDNRNHYTSMYARIKVLTELGKEWATVEVPYVAGYSATPIIEGRTIHADGTVIPLLGKAEDLLVFKAHNNHVKAAVFNLPSVEVGSILEYKWTIPITGGGFPGAQGGEGEEDYYSSLLAGSTPVWEVQQPIYVHKEHFYYNPFSDLESNVGGDQAVTHYADGERASYLLCIPRLPSGFQVGKSPKGDYSLDIQDVPAIVQEADAPPLASLQYRVRFYWSAYTGSQVYWENESKRWSKKVEQFASQSGAIRDAAAQIVAGADTPAAKARKLYDAVQALDNTDSRAPKPRPSGGNCICGGR